MAKVTNCVTFACYNMGRTWVRGLAHAVRPPAFGALPGSHAGAWKNKRAQTREKRKDRKNMKKILALVIAALLALSMVAALAGTNTAHTITVTTNGDGTHTYGAYQIFVGNLDATGKKLSDVAWGSAVTDGVKTALATAINANTTLSTLFAGVNLSDAQAVADKLGTVTNEADAAKAFADAVNTALGSAAATASGTTNSSKIATINVTGDGYYFIKDTAEVADTDTTTRFMLQVVGNIAVTAKDTVLTPDKEIVAEDDTAVTPTKDNDASIGDVITYNVTIPVPDTTQYKNHFVLEMNDTLEGGLTYFGNLAITINGTALPTDNYEATVKTGDADFTTPTTAAAAVTTAGGQTIKVLFKNFKAYVEANNLIGKDIVISYQAVLNDDATYGVNSNDNTVYFNYSNNPNHNYDGDGVPEDDEVVGKTPNSKTKTFVTTLELFKEDGTTKQALAGAEFLLTGTSWNNVLVTGEKFEAATYTAAEGETVQNGTYYKLLDGSYTTQAKTDLTAAQYEDGDKTYVKVTFAKVVKQAKNVNLTLITGEDGYIKVEGIEQGNYTLKETKAPTGYNLDDTEYKLVIDWNNPDADGAAQALKDAGGFSKGAETHEKFSMDTDGAKFKITLDNFSGSTLPSTGGMGTTILYIGGSILVLAAVILLVTKRRMNAED